MYSVLFFILYAFVYVGIIRQNRLGLWKRRSINRLFLCLLAGAVLLRFYIANKVLGHSDLIHFLPIAADFLSTGLIYRYALLKRLRVGTAFGIASLFALNPAVLFHAAVWGQASSYFILLVVIYAVSAGKRIALSIAMGSLFVLLGIFATSTSRPWAWLLTVIKHVFYTDTFATGNAFNLFALTGGNGYADTDRRMLLSYNEWGIILVAAALSFAGYLLFHKRTPINLSKIMFTLLLLNVSVFVLAPHMRISYLLPAIPLALISYILSKDRRILQLFLGFSLTHYINVGYSYSYSKTAIPLITHVDGIMMVTSLANVVLLIYLVYVGLDLFINKRTLTLAPLQLELTSEEPRMMLTRKDWLWMGGLTLVYALIAFYNLGSMKSPETMWKPVSGDTFYVDLGAAKSIDRVNVFSGIGEGKFTVEFGVDSAKKWENLKTVETLYTTVFKWINQKVDFKARYVKITVVSQGFTLNEMALFEKDQKTPLTIQSVHSEDSLPATEGKIANLFDEQSAAVYRSTFMNETYFDEIYHARTAYEHLHLIKPYETTHPPLGKLLILLGIKVFGLNPFGWRVVGTLFGVGMIPLMYIFGKRLFGKSEYALVSAFLMAFDFMHFAQTRIATIDVYGVFFIILMFYYMLRFYQLNFYKVALSKTLRPLFLSGLFFGIGAASKWIVIYGGAGLALIFALTLYDRYREYEAARKLLNRAFEQPPDELLPEYTQQQEKMEFAQHIVHVFPKRTIKTIAWCSLFFIIIPVIIYSLSFFPIMAVPGEGHTVKQLVKYQVDMYDYHSKLKATHPFSSAWWEWPLEMRPIWYYSGQEVSSGNVSSIASFGNPAIWWAGLFALIATIFVSRKRKDKGMFVVLIAYFSQYVPWMLVSRLTFIYHYFAMVPFIILCIVYMMKVLLEYKSTYRKYAYIYLALVLGLFVMFYPVLSGMVVNKNYVDYVLRWFESWTF
jgi:dolichyl-phosphate-mannose-protein mannosyltransferase